MIKFLASDFDGTLYRNNEISKQDMSALEKIKKSGNKMILATGRSLKEITPMLSKYQFEYDYLVLCNGAIIFDKDLNIIKNNIISNETRKAIINKFYNIGDALIYYDDGNGVKIIRNDSVTSANKENYFLTVNTNVVSLEEALEEDCSCEIMSIFSINNSIENSERIRTALLESNISEIEAFRNSYFVDIISKGCSKGNALLDILKMEQATPEQIYCIGDSMNDVSMLNITENSYTFNYTEDIVKKYASHLVDSVAEVVEQM